MATRTVYLVRHGDYQKDAEGDKNRVLTALGRKQARITAKRIRSIPVTSLCSSDMTRAVQTAEIICRELDGMPFKRKRVLRECIPFIPPRVNHQPYFANFPRDVLKKSRQQADAAFETYFGPTRGKDKHEVLVCHGNLIRYLVCRVLDIPKKTWMDMGTRHCGITEVRIRPGGSMAVISYNDVGHLAGKV